MPWAGLLRIVQFQRKRKTAAGRHSLAADYLPLVSGLFPACFYAGFCAGLAAALPIRPAFTPGREDTALLYAGYIGDEDQSPEDRAADRAERFSDYRDKRAFEAGAAADAFDDGPAVVGFQSQARADRAVHRLDRFRTCAVNQWQKSEYWQYRTAGVISHALHKAAASVRRGRILVIEAELRKEEKNADQAVKMWQLWQSIQAETDTKKADDAALYLAGSSGWYGGYDYQHPRIPDKKSSLYSLLTWDQDKISGHEAAALALASYHEGGPLRAGGSWSRQIEHLKNRLSYERQMLEAEGGTAAAVDMVPGGFIGNHQIIAVNRSPVTKQVVSVKMLAPRRWHNGSDPAPLTLQTFNIQRLPAGAYRAPSEEEKETFNKAQKSQKQEQKNIRAENPGPKLINPTLADAQRLQEALNAANNRGKASEVYCMTQDHYSRNSGGSYSAFETVFLKSGPYLSRYQKGIYSADDPRDKRNRPSICKIRRAHGGELYSTDRVIVITDKPQSPIPDWTLTAETKPESAALTVQA